jgi:hypothetical protein
VGFESRFLEYYGSQIITVDISAVEHNEREGVKQVTTESQKVSIPVTDVLFTSAMG